MVFLCLTGLILALIAEIVLMQLHESENEEISTKAGDILGYFSEDVSQPFVFPSCCCRWEEGVIV